MAAPWQPSAETQQVRRQIWIVTTPVKAMGPTRKGILRLLMAITGSQLTWAMHWAIEIDGTYFELQRVPESRKPTLSVSRWADDKKGDIVTRAFAGTTALSNEEIVAKGYRHFHETVPDKWYNVYENSCQTFVDLVMFDISQDHQPEDRARGVAIIMTRTLAISTLPFIVMYLRTRGCPPPVTSQYTQQMFMFYYYLISRMFRAYFEPLENLVGMYENTTRPLLAVIVALYELLIWTPIYVQYPWRSCPVVKRSPEGEWEILNPFTLDRKESDTQDLPSSPHVSWSARISGSLLALLCWVSFIAVICLTQ